MRECGLGVRLCVSSAVCPVEAIDVGAAVQQCSERCSGCVRETTGVFVAPLRPLFGGGSTRCEAAGWATFGGRSGLSKDV